MSKPVKSAISSPVLRLCLRSLFFVLATGGCLGAAQCPVKTAPDHMTVAYEFSPHIDGDANTLHVKVTVQGAGSDQFFLRMPGKASKNTVSPWINLKAESAGTKIGTEDGPRERLVHFTPGRPVVFSYDLQKDWPGPLVNA